jgi:hypothetical protein
MEAVNFSETYITPKLHGVTSPKNLGAKTEKAFSSGILVHIYQTTRRHVPEECRRENGGIIFLNVCTYLPNYTTSHLKKNLGAKIYEAFSSGMSVPIYQTTLRHILEN